MEFKEILKTRRQELDLTLDDVGRYVGVSGATVSRWENGDIENIRRDKIAKLAEVLKVTPSYLMGWENKEDIGLGLDLQLSSKAVSVLRLFPRTIDRRTGLTLMDVLNALLENEKTQSIIKDLLFYCVRSDSEWNELTEKMNAELPADLQYSVNAIKKMSKYSIVKSFDDLIDALSDSGIQPYNKIETTKDGIMISARSETTLLRSLIDED